MIHLPRSSLNTATALARTAPPLHTGRLLQFLNRQRKFPGNPIRFAALKFIT
jgi:hypothetical protein